MRILGRLDIAVVAVAVVGTGRMGFGGGGGCASHYYYYILRAMHYY